MSSSKEALSHRPGMIGMVTLEIRRPVREVSSRYLEGIPWVYPVQYLVTLRTSYGGSALHPMRPLG